MRKYFGLLVVLSLFAASSAFATITFDPNTGRGFVGKGDVQTACGWNNPQCQANAGNVSFTYNVITTYTATCTWQTGIGTNGYQVHTITRTKTFGINSTIAYSARTHSQIDGFLLNGFSSYSETGGQVPVAGTSCPGQGTDGVWSDVTVTTSGGLHINCGTAQ